MKMFKKIAAILAAATMMLGFAGQAMANFENMDLVRIVYNAAGTQEVATDLGSLSSLLKGGSASATSFLPSGATSLFGNTALSNLNVVYLAYDANNINQAPAWFSADQAPNSIVSSTAWQNTVSGLQSLYAGQTGNPQQVSVSQTDPRSYVYNLGTGANGQQGTLGLLFMDANAEANLAALANGSITQNFYYFSDTINGSTAQLLGTVITKADGTSVFTAQNGSPVPIPPAFFLMGSGLLGMVGIRRRFNA